jgi:putative DNA primase/helicase
VYDPKLVFSQLIESGRTSKDLKMTNKTSSPENQKKESRESSTDWIVRVVNESAELWHTPDLRPYATLPFQDKSVRNINILGTEFKYKISNAYFANKNAAPSSRSVKEAAEILAGLAVISGAEYEAKIRLARVNDEIYVDLCDQMWRVVQIDGTGWKIVKKSPLRFIRSTGMRELPEPESGGTLEEFREILPHLSDENWIKLQGFLIGVFNPVGTQPVLVITGGQGSGKSSMVEMISNLIDPNQVPSRSMPKKVDDLFVATENCRLLVFDNVSQLSADQSDALAQMSSGGGMTKRKLYSDTDEILITTRQPIILNGITDFVERPDLDERSIHIPLESIDPNERRLDSELRERFEEMRPRLLGAIFDAVSVALRESGNVKLDGLPRLAEMTHFVTAAESALQMEPGEFVRVMQEQGVERSESRAGLEPVAIAIRDHVRTVTNTAFEGTVGELLERIVEWLPNGPNYWTPRKLGGEIRRLTPDLKAIGIHIVSLGRSRHGNRIRITFD